MTSLKGHHRKQACKPGKIVGTCLPGSQLISFRGSGRVYEFCIGKPKPKGCSRIGHTRADCAKYFCFLDVQDLLASQSSSHLSLVRNPYTTRSWYSGNYLWQELFTSQCVRNDRYKHLSFSPSTSFAIRDLNDDHTINALFNSSCNAHSSQNKNKQTNHDPLSM